MRNSCMKLMHIFIYSNNKENMADNNNYYTLK